MWGILTDESYWDTRTEWTHHIVIPKSIADGLVLHQIWRIAEVHAYSNHFFQFFFSELSPPTPRSGFCSDASYR